MEESSKAMSDPTCKACLGTWPRQDHFIVDLGLSKAYLHEDQFFPGWTIVVFQRHATELFHLTLTERSRLIEEVNQVASTLAEIYHAKKINYELLGNQLPHIHWHVIPRLPNDPAPLEPVWRVSHTPIVLTESALQEAITRLASPLHMTE